MLPKSDTEACSRSWERRVAQARWEPGYQEEQGAEALAESLAVSREAPVVECGRWVAGWPGLSVRLVRPCVHVLSPYNVLRYSSKVLRGPDPMVREGVCLPQLGMGDATPMNTSPRT